MTLLPAKMSVRCLQSNQDVNVKETCFPCKHFHHIAYIGNIPNVYCVFPKYASTVKAEEEKQQITPQGKPE